MANIMSQLNIKNKASRNGFDLSKKRAFTSKVGELLPVYVREVMPGDKFKVKQDWFTRTLPVNTAAYTRMREYYDWFFVPFDQLWRYFNQFYSNMPRNAVAAESITKSNVVGEDHPYFTSSQLASFIGAYSKSPDSSPGPSEENQFGFSRGLCSAKLLWYLGYGKYFYDFSHHKVFPDISSDYPGDVSFSSLGNLALNPFPLLAYQKIYCDFYRDQNWENNQPWTYNIDYISTTGSSLNIPVSLIVNPSTSSPTMFDLRYANWNKDLFMGLLPNAQYGDVASVDMSLLDDKTLTDYVFKGNYIDLHDMNPANVSDLNPSVTVGKNFYGSNSTLFAPGTGSNPPMPRAIPFMISKEDLKNLAETFNSSLNAIALRQVEALQKYKEILSSGSHSWDNVVEKLYDVHVDSKLSSNVYYIKGFADNVDISEVINQSFPVPTQGPDIAGKGVGVGSDTFDFDVSNYGNRPGVLMCIYHSVPLLDYATGGVNRFARKTNLYDYANPVFDKLGMESVDLYEFSYNAKFLNYITEHWPTLKDWLGVYLGFAPRYIDYKTDYDDVVGAFCTNMGAWTAPVSENYLVDYIEGFDPHGTLLGSNKQFFNYKFFKVNPKILDTIFMVSANSSVDTDQFLINCNFDIKAVRNLDVNGLPY